MAEAKIDGNYKSSVLGVSNADGITTLPAYVDSSTNRWLVSATTDIGVAEDTAHQSGDTGVMMLGVRQDSQSNFGADGDYVPMSVNSSGELRVTSGGTEYSEDVATPSTISGKATLIERDDVLTTVTPVEGDWIGLRGTAEGALWTQDFNSDAILTAAQAVQTAVEGTLTVGSHNVTNAGTFAVQINGSALTALQLIDDVVYVDDADWTDGSSKHALVGGLYQSSPQTVTDGDVAPFNITANGALHTAVQNTVTITGTVTANLGSTDNTVLDNIDTSTSGSATSLAIMDDWDNAASDGASVSGDVAHDAVDAGEPLKIGGKAVTSIPTAVSANDRVNAQFDIYGKQVVIEGLREMKGSQITTITSSTSETTVVTADATYKLDIYGIILTNTSATPTEVSFKDSTSGTTRFTLSVPENDMRGFMLPISAAHLQTTSNNNWTATCADSVASIIITVLYIKNL